MLEHNETSLEISSSTLTFMFLILSSYFVINSEKKAVSLLPNPWDLIQLLCCTLSPFLKDLFFT